MSVVYGTMANVAGAPMARHFWIESNRDIESRSFAGLYLKVSQLCLLYHLITVIAHLCEGCKKLLYLYKENNFTLHACFFVINKLRVKIYIHMHQLERYWPGGSVHMACQHGSAPNWVQWGGAQPLQRPQQHWNRVTTNGAFHQSRSNLIWLRIRG